jgi:hypothetical protein
MPSKQTIDSILEQALNDALWCLPDVKGAVRVDREKLAAIKAEAHAAIERMVGEAKISAAEEILSYRSYEVGEGAKPIVMPKGEKRRFVDEFDLWGHINTWKSELAELQRLTTPTEDKQND